MEDAKAVMAAATEFTLAHTKVGCGDEGADGMSLDDHDLSRVGVAGVPERLRRDAQVEHSGMTAGGAGVQNPGGAGLDGIVCSGHERGSRWMLLSERSYWKDGLLRRFPFAGASWNIAERCLEGGGNQRMSGAKRTVILCRRERKSHATTALIKWSRFNESITIFHQRQSRSRGHRGR